MKRAVYSKVLVQAAIAGLVLAGLAHAAGSADGESRLIPPRSSEKSARSGASGGRTAQGPRAAASGWWSTLGGLAAVVALILITAKLLRKKIPGATAALPANVMQVLGRKSLDYRHTIHLVRIGSRLLILGSSQDGLRTLSEITDRVEVDCLAGLCEANEHPPSSLNFGDVFRRIRSPIPANPRPDLEPEPDSDPAVIRLHERLRLAGRDNTANGNEPLPPEAAG